jgi:hypothetical protein
LLRLAVENFGLALLRVSASLMVNPMQRSRTSAAAIFVTTHWSIFEFNGGTLKPGGTFHNNGRLFTVGDGARAAMLRLAGGTHGFTNGRIP